MIPWYTYKNMISYKCLYKYYIALIYYRNSAGDLETNDLSDWVVRMCVFRNDIGGLGGGGSNFLCLRVMEWMYALVQVQGHISDCPSIWRQILGSCCSLLPAHQQAVVCNVPHPYLEPNALWKSLPNTEQRETFSSFSYESLYLLEQ